MILDSTHDHSNTSFVEHGLIEIFGNEFLNSFIGSTEKPFAVKPLKETAIKKIGIEETSGMVQRSGRAAFYYWMHQTAGDLGWRETDFRLLSVAVRIKRCLSDLLAWLERDKSLKAELEETPQSWRILVNGLTHAEAQLDCDVFLGFIQEAICWASGKYHPAHETQCQTSGAPCCIFTIDKQSAD